MHRRKPVQPPLSEVELADLVVKRLAERNAPPKRKPKLTMSYRSVEALRRHSSVDHARIPCYDDRVHADSARNLSREWCLKYKTLNSGLSAAWMGGLAAANALVIVLGFAFGIYGPVSFAMWVMALGALGVYLASPQLRFARAGWACDQYVLMCIAMLDNEQRWALMLHPFPRVLLAKSLWRRMTYLQYQQPENALSYTAPILTRKNLKDRYADKLQLVGASNLYGDFMPHRGLAVALELVDEYGLSANTMKQLVASTGGPEEAKELLDSGIPVEYILAMGGSHASTV